tara:strand:+ start:11346 stop:11807 length:462 start_codon:yes stop_codon:yes gene_type:complete
LTKKYILDEFPSQESYDLIGIHSNIEDFSLAYLINKNLGSSFIRSKKSMKYNQSEFESFIWENKKDGVNCSLISNKSIITSSPKKSSASLFVLSETKKVSLIEELSEVDYFLKIKFGMDIILTIKNLVKLPEIILAYIVKEPKIKSQFNLIYD